MTTSTDAPTIVSLFEDDEGHCIALLGQLFRQAADDAESDGCDEYWWRTAGLKAVIAEIDRRLTECPPADVLVMTVVAPNGYPGRGNGCRPS